MASISPCICTTLLISFFPERDTIISHVVTGFEHLDGVDVEFQTSSYTKDGDIRASKGVLR